MKVEAAARIRDWVIGEGLAGLPETELLDAFSDKCRRAGMPLARSLVIIDTLHPVFEGRAFRWRADGKVESAFIDYARTSQGGEAAANWQKSIFFHLYEGGTTAFRTRLTTDAEARKRFPQLQTLSDEGVSDYLALIHRFRQSGSIGEMDAVYSHWLTENHATFSDADIAALQSLFPALALGIKCGATARIADNLVQAYLGRDAGRRVLSGRIARGVADTIGATLWFSDLRSYTTISDGVTPGEIIPFLNDYAEAVIAAIHEAGGDVLKLIGDGVLAIFADAEPEETCQRALRAEAGLRARLGELNQRREAEGRPTTQVYLGLHVGEVFYGNIGSTERLDFTVVGPAVNEVSRIASMCRSVDRHMLVSSDFCAALPPHEATRLVSVGRYALRGFSKAQELFTLDPGEI